MFLGLIPSHLISRHTIFNDTEWTDNDSITGEPVSEYKGSHLYCMTQRKQPDMNEKKDVRLKESHSLVIVHSLPTESWDSHKVCSEYTAASD